MELSRLTLVNFRNFEHFAADFAPVSVVVGFNSSGKTNLLESIYLASIGKNLKGEQEMEMIKFGKNFAKVSAFTKDKVLDVRLSLVGGRFKKEFLVNGLKKRLVDYLGVLRTVVFSPDDLSLVTDSPSLRREHLNTLLSQLDADYHRASVAYDKALQSRNKLLAALAERKAQKGELEFWDKALTKLGTFIIQKRRELFLFLDNFKSEFGKFSWRYWPNLISIERLKAVFERDLQTTVTNVGPHRDEFRFFLEGNDLGLYGSRGEQRLAVLTLKLAELDFVSSKTGTRPVLLLDDIFSELDYYHRQQIAKVIASQQTILTTTDLEYLAPEIKRVAKVIPLG